MRRCPRLTCRDADALPFRRCGKACAAPRADEPLRGTASLRFFLDAVVPATHWAGRRDGGGHTRGLWKWDATILRYASRADESRDILVAPYSKRLLLTRPTLCHPFPS